MTARELYNSVKGLTYTVRSHLISSLCNLPHNNHLLCLKVFKIFKITRCLFSEI